MNNDIAFWACLILAAIYSKDKRETLVSLFFTALAIVLCVMPIIHALIAKP